MLTSNKQFPTTRDLQCVRLWSWANRRFNQAFHNVAAGEAARRAGMAQFRAICERIEVVYGSRVRRGAV